MNAARRAKKKANLKMKRERIANLRIAAETQELLDRATARKEAKQAAGDEPEPVLESEHAAAVTAKGAIEKLKAKFAAQKA